MSMQILIYHVRQLLAMIQYRQNVALMHSVRSWAHAEYSDSPTATLHEYVGNPHILEINQLSIFLPLQALPSIEKIYMKCNTSVETQFKHW